MGLTEQFTNLGENLLGSFDARVNFLGKNIVDTHRFLDTFKKGHKAMGKKLRHDLSAFVGDIEEFVDQQQAKFKKDHKDMARKQRTNLHAFTENLTDTVEGIRNKFQKEQKQVHQECKANHQAWEKVSKTMATKRKNFKAALTGAKQKASRSH